MALVVGSMLRGMFEDLVLLGVVRWVRLDGGFEGTSKQCLSELDFDSDCLPSYVPACGQRSPTICQARGDDTASWRIRAKVAGVLYNGMSNHLD